VAMDDKIKEAMKDTLVGRYDELNAAIDKLCYTVIRGLSRDISILLKIVGLG